MGELENPSFLEMVEQTNPVSIGIAAICIFMIAIIYRKQLYDIFETYVMGRIFKKEKEETKEDDEKEVEMSTQNILSLLLSLQDEIMDIKDTQTEMKKKQEYLQSNLSNIQSELSITNEKMNRISESQEFLIQSDKEDKKAFITREYNYFCGKVGKIDLFSKETIEKIYDLYISEGGDTFVKGMMTSIRTLPTIGQPAPPIEDGEK